MTSIDEQHSSYLPPSVRRMGLPVRVMVMSERNRLPAKLWAALPADRAATRGETILAVVSVSKNGVQASNWYLRVRYAWRLDALPTMELGVGSRVTCKVTGR